MRYQGKRIIAIVGPTAVGKSAFAVQLAKKFNGEVISADSRQVYRGLNIGTGKITRREMRGVPHHLLDVANPKKQFNVAEYQKLARQKIQEIRSRGKLPIICGGTGLYVDSVLKSTVFPEAPPNPILRKKLEKKSVVGLFEMLKKLDPRRAKTIDRNNPRRLVRAIEIAKALGHVPTRPDLVNKVGPSYQTLWIGLTLPPEELKKKIAIRLFARLRRPVCVRTRTGRDFGGQARASQDMITEVARLHERRLSWKRMEELGLEYRYISRYLRGRIAKNEMIEMLRTESWHYAKRQMTWFNQNKKIKWFLPSQKAQIFAMLKSRGL